MVVPTNLFSFFFLCAAAATFFALVSSSFRFPDEEEQAATRVLKKQVRLSAATAAKDMARFGS